MPKAIRNPSNAIMEALVQKNKATWAELLEATKLSKGALSSYLTKMIKDKQIETETDTSKRPPKTLYKLVDPEPQFKNKNPLFLNTDYTDDQDYDNPNYVAFAIKVGHLISIMEDREKAKELLKEYLQFITNYLVFDVMAAVRVTYMLSEHDKKSLSNTTGEAVESKDKTDETLKIWKNHHDKFDEDQILQAIFWTAYKNKDIALDGEDSVYNSFALEKSEKISQSFMTKFIDRVAKTEKEASDKGST